MDLWKVVMVVLASFTKFFIVKNIQRLARIAVILNVVYAVELMLKWGIIRLREGQFIPVLGAFFLSPLCNLSLILALILIKKPNTPLPVSKWIWYSCLCVLLFQLFVFLQLT